VSVAPVSTSTDSSRTTKAISPARQLLGRSSMWRWSAFVALIIVFSFISPGFLTRANWLNTSLYASTTLILAVAETSVIITAGIDLSVGAILGVASAVTAVFLADVGSGTWPVILAASVLGIVAASGIGLINGLIITVLDVSPFITTLGMLGIATGATYLITAGTDVIVPNSISPLGNGVWLDWIPVPVAIGVILCVLVGYLLKGTRFGIWTYAIGSDGEAARRAGIPINSHRVRIYVLSGFLSGIAGVLTAAQFVEGSPTAGANAELDAIAAVVIGGASLFGGTGGVLGSFVGTAIISMIVTALVLAGASPYWQTVVIGIIIIAAVVVQQGAQRGHVISARRRGRKRLRRAKGGYSFDGHEQSVATGGSTGFQVADAPTRTSTN
jgi:ribose transport system permease protein